MLTLCTTISCRVCRRAAHHSQRMERGGLEEPFGIVLRRLRAEAGLSQEDLAERAGIHPNYVVRLERGTSSPSLSAITLVARALGTTPSKLLAAAEREAARQARSSE